MPRGKKANQADSDATLLRTTADVLANALKQLECCATRWDEYRKPANDMRLMVEGLVEHAKGYGYVAKGGCDDRPMVRRTP